MPITLWGGGHFNFVPIGKCSSRVVRSRRTYHRRRRFKPRRSKTVRFNKFPIRLNSIIGRGTQPRLVAGAAGVRVRHREFLGDVVSHATPKTFQLQEFIVNPGLVATFPWLSSIAQGYQQYAIRGMAFYYRTTSVDALNNTDTSLGVVICSTQYNLDAAKFQNKHEMDAYEYTNSCKPSRSMMHPVECAHSMNPLNILFNRNDDVTVLDSFKYDHCKFSIATDGMQGSSVKCGELWVAYDIEFMKARTSPFPNGVFQDVYRFTELTIHPLGTITSRSAYSNNNCGTTVDSQPTFATLYFPDVNVPWNWLIIRWYQLNDTVADTVGQYSSLSTYMTGNGWHDAPSTIPPTTGVATFPDSGTTQTSTSHCEILSVTQLPNATAPGTRAYVQWGSLNPGFSGKIEFGGLMILSVNPYPSTSLPPLRKSMRYAAESHDESDGDESGADDGGADENGEFDDDAEFVDVKETKEEKKRVSRKGARSSAEAPSSSTSSSSSSGTSLSLAVGSQEDVGHPLGRTGPSFPPASASVSSTAPTIPIVSLPTPSPAPAVVPAPTTPAKKPASGGGWFG